MKFTKIIKADSYNKEIKQILTEVDKTLERVKWQLHSYKSGLGYTGIMTDNKTRLEVLKTALAELNKFEQTLDNGDYLPNYETDSSN